MNTATGFLPREWCWSPGVKRPVLPVGHHLIWFNAAVPTQELLPDGTDASQSPGDPWVRRMWAGGSLQIKPDDYVDPISGFRLDAPILGAERIKDVQLRGQGDGAKIFVTIERRFARVDRVQENYRKMHGSIRRGHIAKTQRFFEEQLRDAGWGDSILTEERNLVFFKERTAEEKDAIKAGQLAPVRYLDRPSPHRLAWSPANRS
jgi:hydroxyacyl-ACP dehydratase HTD2-like protein with hotdog domain